MSVNGLGIILERCNPYGAETGGAVPLGGLSNQRVPQQWYCKNRSTARYRMTCAHGHRGQIMPLCEAHAREFGTKKITFCPRCNVPPNDHKCELQLTEVS